MRTRNNLPINKIAKGLQINFSVFKRCNQSRNRTTKHGVSPSKWGLDCLSLTRTSFAVYLITISTIIFSPPADASPSETIQLIFDENWTDARNAVIQSGDPVLYKLYEWALYRDDLNGLPYDRIASFIDRNPSWPDQNRLLATAERNMPDDLAPASMLSWFIKHPPVTGKGIGNLLKSGAATQTSVIHMVNELWPKAFMDQYTQSDLFQKYGQTISIQAQNARLDYLLKNESYTQARALATLIGKGYPQLVEARIALREGKRGGEDLVYQIPNTLQNNTGLLLERIRNLRKNDNNAAAANLLNKASLLKDITFPEDWWKERNILVRRLIEDRNFSKAYALASSHGLENGTEFAEAEWLSGWLALRFLNKPDVAYAHFAKMYNKVETAISKARGAYWAARAADRLGKESEANTWYYQASTYPHTYYGQIALNHLKIQPPTQILTQATPSDQTSIASSDLVQAAALLHDGGYESLSAKFISAKLTTLSSKGEYQAFSNYLKKMGDISGAYRVAKQASWKNIFLGDAAYPSLTKWVNSASIDPALAHAIIRQESQFDVSATSPAGALGLMQLMPRTAAEIAKKRGWTHQTSWLTSKPDHNILLGSAYLNDLLKRFNGSYPLAIAAYNAGPSRVNGWLEAFGDPRGGHVNWIDWLELIPVAETRNYVQRVTEGIVTYRDHLGMIKK